MGELCDKTGSTASTRGAKERHMNSNVIQDIAKRAIQFVECFFGNLTEIERESVPPVLKSTGTWVASYDESMLGIFFLDEAEQQRVKQYQNRGWHPFPGLMVSEAQKPPEARVAMKVGGSCNFFASNHTSNLFAFEVSPGSSFTVVDHFHEIRDSLGQEFKYHVALAFVLGIHQGEQWPDVQRRLSELLNHSMSVWRRLR
jgi:hypothetical protein